MRTDRLLRPAPSSIQALRRPHCWLIRSPLSHVESCRLEGQRMEQIVLIFRSVANGNTSHTSHKTPPSSPRMAYAWASQITTCFTVTSPKREKSATNAGTEATRNDFSAAYRSRTPCHIRASSIGKICFLRNGDNTPEANNRDRWSVVQVVAANSPASPRCFMRPANLLEAG